jgi:hypothetical protein
MNIEFLCETLIRLHLPDVPDAVLRNFALENGAGAQFDEAVLEYVNKVIDEYRQAYPDLGQLVLDEAPAITYPTALRNPAEMDLQDYSDLTISVYAEWQKSPKTDSFLLRRLIVDDLAGPHDQLKVLELQLRLKDDELFSPLIQDFGRYISDCFVGIEAKNWQKAKQDLEVVEKILANFNFRWQSLRQYMEKNAVHVDVVALEHEASLASGAMQQILEGVVTVGETAFAQSAQ